ncbi:unnamed protein product [Ilex paraguariensis]|uniref:Uncharacterized protein n=1 Tax=Ilex paraguariensis TaxID=185542 RepID=A0ABC8SNB5_9AQUA
MHHTPHVDLAFNSVDHIMKDVERAWLLHYMLANGTVSASLLHLAALLQYGPNNMLGVHSEMDEIASYPYFYNSSTIMKKPPGFSFPSYRKSSEVALAALSYQIYGSAPPRPDILDVSK